MSEALFAIAAKGRHQARSAGTSPASHVHPNVVDSMRELEIDLAGKAPARVTDELARWADVVVTMGCGDSCPVFPGARYVDWDLADPKDLPPAEVRAIRDDIMRRVNDLVKELDQEGNHR